MDIILFLLQRHQVVVNDIFIWHMLDERRIGLKFSQKALQLHKTYGFLGCFFSLVWVFSIINATLANKFGENFLSGHEKGQ